MHGQTHIKITIILGSTFYTDVSAFSRLPRAHLVCLHCCILFSVWNLLLYSRAL